MIGDIYVAIFSHQSISKPDKPMGIEGIEGIIGYLVSLYTKPSNFVIAPFLGEGEVAIACERMGRICFAGDENPQRVQRAIARWQQWTGKVSSPLLTALASLNKRKRGKQVVSSTLAIPPSCSPLKKGG